MSSIWCHIMWSHIIWCHGISYILQISHIPIIPYKPSIKHIIHITHVIHIIYVVKMSWFIIDPSITSSLYHYICHKSFHIMYDISYIIICSKYMHWILHETFKERIRCNILFVRNLTFAMMVTSLVTPRTLIFYQTAVEKLVSEWLRPGYPRLLAKELANSKPFYTFSLRLLILSLWAPVDPADC